MCPLSDYRLRSEVDNALGIVCLSVTTLTAEPFDLLVHVLCQFGCNQRAYVDNLADAVDWLLITNNCKTTICAHWVITTMIGHIHTFQLNIGCIALIAI